MIRATVIALATLAALVGALRFASSLIDLDVDVVRVSGPLSDAESAQVSEVVTTALAEPGLRTAAGVARAVQALDWVREVRVRREWPEVLRIEVARETLAARWGEDAWLTTSGNIVSAPAVAVPTAADQARLAALPVLRANGADGARAMRIFASLSDVGRSAGLRLVGLDEDAGGEWRASFDGGAQVLLGTVDLSARLERFATVYRAALRDAKRAFDHADARYDTGVAVRWRPLDAPRLELAALSPRPRGDDGLLQRQALAGN